MKSCLKPIISKQQPESNDYKKIETIKQPFK